MSNKGRQLDHQSGSPNIDHDYENNEEKFLLALAKLRLLNDKEHPIPLEQVITRARQLHGTYQRWENNKGCIRGIDVRLSNGEDTSLAQIHNTRGGNMSFIASLPSGTVLQIWKEADEQFDEVLLLTLSLSAMSPDMYCVEKEYPNGQTLSLRVKHRSSGEFSISVGFSEPESQVRAYASRLHNIVAWPWMARPAYAFALVTLVLIAAMGLNVILLKRDFRELPNSELAQVPVRDASQSVPIPNELATTRPRRSKLSSDVAVASPSLSEARQRLSASSFDEPSALSKHCVVGEAESEFLENTETIKVLLSRVDLRLCNYSAHGARRIEARVGVMNAGRGRSGKVGKVLWSQSVLLSERLSPGETFSLADPIIISIPKRRSVNMRNAKFIIQLISVPDDSNVMYHSSLYSA